MRKFFYLFLLLYLPLYGSIEIDEHTTDYQLLHKSFIYIDDTNLLTKKDIENKIFHPINKKVLNFGFVYGKTLWIKFQLKNISNKTLYKHFTYQIAEEITFYDDTKILVDTGQRDTIKPFFHFTLKPYEEKTFYIQAYSKTQALRAKMVLYNYEDALKYDYTYKIAYGVFFGILFIMFIYNSLLWFITKDRLYGFYLFYLSSLIIFQFIYLGAAEIYTPEFYAFFKKGTMIYISLLIFAISLFTIEFLNFRKFPKIYKFFKIYFILLVIASIISYNNWIINLDITLILTPWIFFIIFSSFYSWYKGESQAKFYVFSWFFIMLIFLFALLRTVGLFTLNNELLLFYFYIVSFTLEVIIFSLSITYKIELLSKNEQIRLENLVKEKTYKLNDALALQTLLYKELHHRIKNTISMIISLFSLQIRKTHTKKVKSELLDTKNRISALVNLYETLYFQNNTFDDDNIDIEIYFTNIIENIQKNFTHKYHINLDILYTPNYDKLTYLGLIVNELITNSFKYAFKDSIGNINLKLFKEINTITLIIEDNGIGFKNNSYGFGLEIVQSLVETQLFGSMYINTTQGTKTVIQWEEENEEKRV